jgi:hypothetical protein
VWTCPLWLSHEPLRPMSGLTLHLCVFLVWAPGSRAWAGQGVVWEMTLDAGAEPGGGCSRKRHLSSCCGLWSPPGLCLKDRRWEHWTCSRLSQGIQYALACGQSAGQPMRNGPSTVEKHQLRWVIMLGRTPATLGFHTSQSTAPAT